MYTNKNISKTHFSNLISMLRNVILLCESYFSCERYVKGKCEHVNTCSYQNLTLFIPIMKLNFSVGKECSAIVSRPPGIEPA